MKVPVFSRNDEAGSTTSANLVVSVSKMSWQTRKSSDSSAATTCLVFGSVWATSSPKMYIALRLPSTAASNISGIFMPRSRFMVTPQRASKVSLTASSVTGR